MGTRIRTSVTATAAVACLALLAACGAIGVAPSEQGDRIVATNPYGGNPATEGEPKRGGTLVMGTDREVVSFDTTVQNANQAAMAVYDSLLKLTPDGTPEPYMAESMESPDNGVTWRLALRPGVMFSDGTPLDANAVIVNVQRHVDKVSSPGHLYTEPIASMRAVDPLTAEFTLKRPFGQFPTAFALGFNGGLGAIISPAALQQYGDDIGSHPVGAGPFVLSEWTRDSRMVLNRNPNYWQAGMPYLDALEFRPLPDTETRYASIENGDVDLIFGGYHTELVRGLDNPNLTVYYGPGHGAEWVYFNHTRPPFDDHRMREAVVRGIDLDALAATQFRNRMTRADGYFGSDSEYQTPEAAAAWPATDIERAKQLVEEYKAEGGNTTVSLKTSNAPNRVAFAEFLQAQMAVIGITVQPEFYDLAQFAGTVVQSRDFDLASFVGGPVDTPYPSASNIFRTGGNANYGGYSNPQMDALLDQAATTTDEAERTRLYQQVQLLSNQDLVDAWYSRGYLSTIAKPEVKGVVRYLNRTHFYATTWLDR
ncbi:ABC transporter substrate-binding protein [Pseudonocardia sp. CA-142604]|uniref:ABC transporter substrate-binding protein n=1 Tax=Pseudonocardia sp. CA-142604 TaxID=3240024 RepID=UPI003D8EA82A